MQPREGKQGFNRLNTEQNAFAGFPGGASDKEFTCQCRRCRRRGFSPWKIPWRSEWNLLQYSCLEIPWTEDSGRESTKNRTQLSVYAHAHVHTHTRTHTHMHTHAHTHTHTQCIHSPSFTTLYVCSFGKVTSPLYTSVSPSVKSVDTVKVLCILVNVQKS